MSRTAENYAHWAIRGNAPYIDPGTGQTRWLPYAPQPSQPFNSGGETYVQGRYFRRHGNAWLPMSPRP